MNDAVTINLSWSHGEVIAVSITSNSVDFSTLSLSTLDDVADEIRHTIRNAGINPPRFFSTPVARGNTLILAD